RHSSRAGCTVLKRVLPAVNALPQMSGFTDSFERRPIRPRADREAVFTTAKPVVEDESASTSSSNTDPKAPRRLCTLDCGSGEISNAVAPCGDRKPLQRFFI